MLISICVPTYNGGKYIEACLQSIYEQTYTDFEVIICDDCSNDDTLEIVNAFKGKDSRIKLFINENNLGLVGNWNRCIELASGEWIKFVFQDDLISNTCLEEMLAATNKDTQMVVCERDYFFEKNTGLKIRRMYYDVPRMYHFVGDKDVQYISAKKLCVLIRRCFPANFIGEPSSIMFKKSVIDKIGLFNPKISQLCDLEYCLRVGIIDGFVYIPRILNSFRVHGSSTSQKNNSEKYFASIYSDRIIILYLMLFDSAYNNFRENCTKLELYKLKYTLFYFLYHANLYVKANKKNALLLKEMDLIKKDYPKIKKLQNHYLLYAPINILTRPFRLINSYIKYRESKLL